MRYTIEVPNKYTEEVKKMTLNELYIAQRHYYFSPPLNPEDELRSAEITDEISKIKESCHT